MSYPSRGAPFNPHNRFLRHSYVPMEVETEDDEGNRLVTRVYIEHARNVVNHITTPDIGEMYSVNPYQGCEHGCIYCYARPTHEYWGWSAGLDFETKIVAKPNAPQLVEKFIVTHLPRRYELHLSGNTDCYQPVERRLQITRGILQVCLRYGNPVSVITKSALVLRDMDILEELAKRSSATLLVSVTTLDEKLRRIMEPRTASAHRRLEVVAEAVRRGITCGVMIAPVIPGLNLHEIPAIMRAAAEAGAQFASYTIVRLNGAVAPLFLRWLERHFPERAQRVISMIKDCHGGSLSDYQAGRRLRGEGKLAESVRQLFEVLHEKYFGVRIKEKKQIHQKYAQKSLFDSGLSDISLC